MTLSSTAAELELPVGKSGDVGWQEGPRDAGFDGEVGPLEEAEEEAVLDHAKGSFEKLDGGDTVWTGRCCCCC